MPPENVVVEARFDDLIPALGDSNTANASVISQETFRSFALGDSLVVRFRQQTAVPVDAFHVESAEKDEFPSPNAFLIT